VFITAGYGFFTGLIVSVMLKQGKVRNTLLALLCGAISGVLAVYFAWSSYIHVHVAESPLLCQPDQVINVMKVLYEHGAWQVRGTTITGIPLAIVWIAEFLIIAGINVLVGYGSVSDTPFCERSGRWLDEERKVNTLAAFTQPDQLTALKAGDLSVLMQAKAKHEGASTFARLIIKHSPRCEDFCTVTVANVTVSTDNKGSVSEKSQELARNIMLPKSMFEHLVKFDQVKPAPAPAA
jgi:hypothetical protein